MSIRSFLNELELMTNDLTIRTDGKRAAVTALQPTRRFGNCEADRDKVVAFAEKGEKCETWIEGGSFFVEPDVPEYVRGDEEPLEQSRLTKPSPIASTAKALADV